MINYDKKTNNYNTATKFSVVESNIQGVEATKAEADKCELHPNIFQWPQEWTFQSIRTVNCSVCVPTQKTGGLITCQAFKQKEWEPAKSQIM